MKLLSMFMVHNESVASQLGTNVTTVLFHQSRSLIEACGLDTAVMTPTNVDRLYHTSLRMLTGGADKMGGDRMDMGAFIRT
jgi:hypothetical protein